MTSIHSPRAGRAKRTGAAAVELAIILTPLTMIMVVCIDLGRAGYSYIALQNAVRAGGGYAVMNPSGGANWSQNVKSTVTQEMTSQTGYNSANLTFLNGTPTVATDSGGPDPTVRYVTITAQYPFHPVTSWLTSGDIQLKATVTLPLLRN